MELPLPLDKMTVSEKLSALEQIWEDLCRTPENIPSPAWHADVLNARRQRVEEGKAELIDWADAKRSIRDSAQ